MGRLDYLAVARLVLLFFRDVYGNALEAGGEEWFVSLRGEEESVSDAGVRHPLVIDYGDGSYAFAVKPGTCNLCGLSCLLESCRQRWQALTAQSADQKAFVSRGLRCVFVIR